MRGSWPPQFIGYVLFGSNSDGVCALRICVVCALSTNVVFVLSSFDISFLPIRRQKIPDQRLLRQAKTSGRFYGMGERNPGGHCRGPNHVLRGVDAVGRPGRGDVGVRTGRVGGPEKKRKGTKEKRRTRTKGRDSSTTGTRTGGGAASVGKVPPLVFHLCQRGAVHALFWFLAQRETADAVRELRP